MNLYLKIFRRKNNKKGETNCDKGIYRKKLLTPNRERNEIRVSFILNKEKGKGRRKIICPGTTPPAPVPYSTTQLDRTIPEQGPVKTPLAAKNLNTTK